MRARKVATTPLPATLSQPTSFFLNPQLKREKTSNGEGVVEEKASREWCNLNCGKTGKNGKNEATEADEARSTQKPESSDSVKTLFKSQMDNVFKVMITHQEPIKDTKIGEKLGIPYPELRKLFGVLENDGLVMQIKPGVWCVTEANL